MHKPDQVPHLNCFSYHQGFKATKKLIQETKKKKKEKENKNRKEKRTTKSPLNPSKQELLLDRVSCIPG